MANTEKVEQQVEEVVEAPKTEGKEEMVPKAAYDELYKQAIELKKRFDKLSALYNTVVETFLSGK